MCNKCELIENIFHYKKIVSTKICSQIYTFKEID